MYNYECCIASFQRTPSFRRKWRKRYGGLDGNKLLEPNKEEDMRGIEKQSVLLKRIIWK